MSFKKNNKSDCHKNLFCFVFYTVHNFTRSMASYSEPTIQPTCLFPSPADEELEDLYK